MKRKTRSFLWNCCFSSDKGLFAEGDMNFVFDDSFYYSDDSNYVLTFYGCLEMNFSFKDWLRMLVFSVHIFITLYLSFD